MSDIRQYFALVFVRHNQQILLAKRDRGMNKGVWNGFGGRLEPNETIYACAARVLKMEANLQSHEIMRVGMITYKMVDERREDVIHVFTGDNCWGEVREDEATQIGWFEYNQIPYSNMWPDTSVWIPQVLKAPQQFVNVNVNYKKYHMASMVQEIYYDCQTFMQVCTI